MFNMSVQESYAPTDIAANGSNTRKATTLGGFLCTVTGVLNASDDTGTIVTNLPVTAGVYYPLPFAVRGASVTVTLSAGAAGTLGAA